MLAGELGGKFGNMNVTPLIDVLLVLLVIFMIITPVTQKGDNVLIPQPPQPDSKPQLDDSTVVVQVLAGPKGEPRLIINQQNVRWQDLNSRLVDIYKTRAQKVLFVKADDGISWQDVAIVIDDAHNAGVNNVGLITAKIEVAG